VDAVGRRQRPGAESRERAPDPAHAHL